MLRKTRLLGLTFMLAALLVALSVSIVGAQDGGDKLRLSSEGGEGGGGVRPPRLGVVLYDQTYGIAGTGTANQILPDFGNNSFEPVDDFVVPAAGWTIDGVFAPGQAGPAMATAGPIVVTFYNDAAGTPGAVACQRTLPTFSYVTSDVTVDFTGNECVLPAGTYWVSTVMTAAFGTYGQWFQERHNDTNGGIFRWRDTGGLISTCTTFQPHNLCGFGAGPIGLAFTLYGNVTAVPLAATGACGGVGNLSLSINITAGDGPFNITGTGPGLPLNGVAAGTHVLTGPGVWSNVTVTETTGDAEVSNLGNFTCATGIASTAVCMGDNLQLTISAGDAPFNLTGTGPGVPANGLPIGTTTLTGPGTWTGLTLTETVGDLQSSVLGDITCATDLLAVNAICVGDNLVLNITAGDGPFNIVGSGPGLPLNGVASGSYTLIGPATWAGIQIAETTGNLQVYALPDTNCVGVGIAVPNLGLIRIGVEQAQPMYDSAGGQPIARNGEKLLLPHDADGSGYDTHIVTEVVNLGGGEIWLGLFIGGPTWVYVPLENVTIIIGVPLP